VNVIAVRRFNLSQDGLMKSGVLTRVRRLVAKIQVNECNGDLSPTGPDSALVRCTMTYDL